MIFEKILRYFGENWERIGGKLGGNLDKIWIIFWRYFG